MSREIKLAPTTTEADIAKIYHTKGGWGRKHRGKHRSHVKGAGMRDFYGITFRRGSGQRQIEKVYSLDSLIQNFE